MNCEDVQRCLVDLAYDEAEKTPNDEPDLRKHLESCELCRAKLSRIGQSQELLCRAADEELRSAQAGPPVDLAAIHAKSGALQRRSHARWRRAAVAMTCAAAVLAGLLLVRIEIHDTHVVVSWSAPPTPPAEPPPAVEVEDLRQAIAEQQDRGEHLETLAKLLAVEVQSANERAQGLERAVLALGLGVDEVRRRDDDRWLVVSRGLHRLRGLTIATEQ